MKGFRQFIAFAMVCMLVFGTQAIAFAAEDAPQEMPDTGADIAVDIQEDGDAPSMDMEIVDEVQTVEEAEAVPGETGAGEAQPVGAMAQTFEVYNSSKGLSLIYTGTDENVTFPAIYNGQKVYGVRGVKEAARQYVKTVTIEDGPTYIDYNAFEGCYNMTNITLPSTLITVGSSVFSGCTALKNVEFPASVTEVGSGAFMNCTSLTKVVIPKTTVVSTSSYMFQNCTVANIWIVGVPGTTAETLALNAGTKFRASEAFKVPVPKSLTLSLPYSSYNKVDISFEVSKYAQKYEIYRSLKKDSGYKLIKTAAPTSQYASKVYYTDATAQPGRTYYYKVRATSSYSSPATKSSFTNPKAIKPTLKAPYLSGSGGVDYVTLRWSQIDGANGYIIYRSTTASGGYTAIKTVTSGATLTYTDKGLGGNDYYYKLYPYRTVDGKKLKGPVSNTARFHR